MRRKQLTRVAGVAFPQKYLGWNPCCPAGSLPRFPETPNSKRGIPRRPTLPRDCGIRPSFIHFYSVCWLEPSKYVQNNSITKHNFCRQICQANNAQGHLSPHTLTTQTIPGVLRCRLIRASKDLLGFKPEKCGPSVRMCPLSTQCEFGLFTTHQTIKGS